VQTDGFSVEAICAQLGITRWKLTQLIKEYCNLTANEYIDGLKLRNLKSFLLGRIREAARDLWGRPGYFAAHKVEGFINCQQQVPMDGLTIRTGGHAHKQSKFFLIKREDLLREPQWAERARRVANLIDRMWEGFDLESWAISAGYSTARRLKRAVLTVTGMTLQQLEEKLAGEVIDYYMCAEDRDLRNLTLRKDENAAVFRAREFYHGSEDPPTEPFCDAWANADPEWLAKMAGEFG
jgi:methylphosphotriester-DNA--protein-cysteine methyltransferase